MCVGGWGVGGGSYLQGVVFLGRWLLSFLTVVIVPLPDAVGELWKQVSCRDKRARGGWCMCVGEGGATILD